MRLAAQHRLRLSPAPHETRLVLSSHLAEPEGGSGPRPYSPRTDRSLATLDDGLSADRARAAPCCAACDHCRTRAHRHAAMHVRTRPPDRSASRRARAGRHRAATPPKVPKRRGAGVRALQRSPRRSGPARWALLRVASPVPRRTQAPCRARWFRGTRAPCHPQAAFQRHREPPSQANGGSERASSPSCDEMLRADGACRRHSPVRRTRRRAQLGRQL